MNYDNWNPRPLSAGLRPMTENNYRIHPQLQFREERNSSIYKSHDGRKPMHNRILIAAIVSVTMLVIGAVVTAVIVTQTSKTQQDPTFAPNWMVTTGSMAVIATTPVSNSVPVIGNYTIENKQISEVSESALCTKMTQELINRKTLIDNCTIIALRPGSVIVRYSINIKKVNEEIDDDTRRRGKDAITHLLMNETAFGFRVKQGSIEFDDVQQTPERTNPESIPFTGNFVIRNKTLEQVDISKICRHINDSTSTRVLLESCNVLDLQTKSDGVSVRIEIKVKRNENEDIRSALRKGSAAVVVAVVDNSTVFEVYPGSITFEYDGVATENSCPTWAFCPGQNVQCVSVINGTTCVCRLGYRRFGNDSNCYNKHALPVQTFAGFQQSVDAELNSTDFCSDVTWIRIGGGFPYSYSYQDYITSPLVCQEVCVSNPNCFGISWYSGSVFGCYLATSSGLFYNYANYYSYYVLVRNQSSCDADSSCSYKWNGFVSSQAFGAVRDPNITTISSCVVSCQRNSNCSAIDWDWNAAYCWLFINSNGSSLTRYHPYIVHFDKSCISANDTTTSAPISTRSPNIPPECSNGAVAFCEPTKQCLFSYQMCDKKQDCLNDIDETNCTCDNNHYQCSNGRCIYRSWMCDGVKDCPLGDDESQCVTCNSNQFLCGKSNMCIMSIQQCDGVADCSDSSDEVKCLTLSGNSTNNNNTQTVKATYKGMAGYFICGDFWDEKFSDAVCQHMGHRNSLRTSYESVSIQAMNILVLDPNVSSSNILAYLRASNCSSAKIVSLTCASAECGQRSVPPDSVGPYIINGQRAKPGAWPWQTLLEIGTYYYYNDLESFTWATYCGAILLNERWLLTAAHCTIVSSNIYLGYSGQVRPENVRISLGSVVRTGDNDTVYATVDKVFTHPLYSTYPVTDNDVGLLRLTEPLNFTSKISPICLPSATEDLSQFRVCVDTGFGRNILGELSDYLLQARMNIIPYRDCYYYYDYYLRSQTQICIGTLPTEMDNNICSGDSGGPFACQDYNGVWKVIGVNSYVIGQSISSASQCSRSIVARVTTYVDWIQQTMAANVI